MSGPRVGCLPQEFEIHTGSELISLKCISVVALGPFFQLPHWPSIPVVDFSFLNSASSKGLLFESSAGVGIS